MGADHSQYMYDFAVMISNDLTGPDTPANAAVARHESMLKHDFPAGPVIQSLAHCPRHCLAVVGVDQR